MSTTKTDTGEAEEIDWQLVESKKPLIEALKENYPEKNEETYHKPGDTFRGHQVGKVCPRQEVLKNLHEVEEVDEIELRVKMIFAFGTGIHEALQQDLLDGTIIGGWRCKGCGKEYGGPDELMARPKECDGVVLDREGGQLRPCPNHNYHEDVEDDWHLPGFEYREIEVSLDDPEFEGHPDGILWRGDGEPPEVVSPDNPYIEVLEIKSANEFVVKYGYGGGTPLNESPAEAHRIQCQVYQYALGIERGRILYVDKSAHDLEEMIFEYTVDLSESLVEDHLDRLRRIDRGIEEEDPSIAPRVCGTPGCKKAERCPVSEPCWSIEESAISYDH